MTGGCTGVGTGGVTGSCTPGGAMGGATGICPVGARVTGLGVKIMTGGATGDSMEGVIGV